MMLAIGLLTITGTAVPMQAGWMIETIDTAGVTGQATSLVLSSMGEPHISYFDYTNNTLKYAVRSGSGWQVEFIEPGIDLIGERSDIILDNAGYPMIVYEGYNDPKFAIKDSMGWHAMFVDTTGNYWGEEPSIDLDSAGSPHISFCKGSSKIYHVFTDGDSWYAELIAENTDGYHQETEIRVDANDEIHIVFLDLATNGGSIRYAHGMTGGSWTVESIATSIGYPGSGYIGFDLSQDLYPHISYFDSDDKSIRYAHSGNNWAPEIVDTNAGAIPWTSLAMDSNGYPHIAYYFENTAIRGDLRYARKDASGWTMQTIETGVYFTGMYTSIALDSGDNPHISYHDNSPSDLKYAYYQPETCSQTGVSISMPSTIFHAGDSSSCTAMVCNASGQNLSGYPLFVILAIGSDYFFAPSFNQVFDNYSGLYPSFATGSTTVTVLPEFMWPAVGGSASGLIWYAALTNPSMSALYGTLGTFTFGWE